MTWKCLHASEILMKMIHMTEMLPKKNVKLKPVILNNNIENPKERTPPES